MLRETLTRWVATAVSGEVRLELRRGDDYTLLETRAAVSAYAPDKLSMEKTASAFSPEDRIGALEMQNISVEDNRALLLHYARGERSSLAPGPDLKELLSGEEE